MDGHSLPSPDSFLAILRNLMINTNKVSGVGQIYIADFLQKCLDLSKDFLDKVRAFLLGKDRKAPFP
jgi:hypothetical protein